MCAMASCALLVATAAGGPHGGHASVTANPTIPVQEKTASTPAAGAGTGQEAQAAMTSEAISRQEIGRECADLLKLATGLKAAVDKSTKDQLSVIVVRKASEIEHLAHKVRTGNPKS